MKLSERLSQLDRAQKSRGFKIGASIALLVLALALAATLLVTGLGESAGVADLGMDAAEDLVLEEGQIDTRDAGRQALELLGGLRERSGGPAGLLVGIGVGAGVGLVVTWIGLLLSYLALGAGTVLVAVPLWLLGYRDLSQFVSGMAALAASFTAILQGMRALYAFPIPVLAIARNTLSEAVRMKLSVVFIVVLMIALPAIPGLLDPDSPLRYRVQSFLQYGTGGAFWIIALLTVTFSVATVAFEQRDRIIWQTMTKPVAAWEYVLGKWLGVSSLAAALLAVNAAGVFLFTEYLRQQPALGEREAYIAAGEGTAVSEDRLVLETQVLSARRIVPVSAAELNQEAIAQAARERAAEQVDRDTSIRTDAQRAAAIAVVAEEFVKEISKEARNASLRIERGGLRGFEFRELGDVVDPDRPAVLRYRIDSGSNRPDVIYQLSISIADSPFVVRQTGLGVTHTLPIAPLILLPGDEIVLLDDPRFEQLAKLVAQGAVPGRYYTIADLLDEDGDLVVFFANGNVQAGVPNAEWLRFAEDGLSVSVGAGSYRANFARVMVVLWLKLAFLAMVGVWAATFLSFPVAMLISMGVFLAAEATPFLGKAIEYFATTDSDNNPMPLHVVAKEVTNAVYWVFRSYGDLRPTRRLVTGEMLEWSMLALATGILGAWTAVLGAVAVIVFRRRELAIYSGR